MSRHVGSNPTPSATSSQAAYRLRRLFYTLMPSPPVATSALSARAAPARQSPCCCHSLLLASSATGGARNRPLLSVLCRLGGQQALHRGAGGVQRVGAQVGVDVRRGGVVGVAQKELDLLHGDAAGHQEAGAGVPEVVEADVAQAVCLQQVAKALGELVRDDEIAQGVHADAVQPLFAVAVPEGLAVGLQLLFVPQELLLHVGDQRQGAAAGLRLHLIGDDDGIALLQRVLVDLVVDVDLIVLPVDAVPLHAADLAATEPVEGREQHGDVDLRTPRCLQELFRLLLRVKLGVALALLRHVHLVHGVAQDVVLAHRVAQAGADELHVVVLRGAAEPVVRQVFDEVLDVLRRDGRDRHAARPEELVDAPVDGVQIADLRRGRQVGLVVEDVAHIVRQRHGGKAVPLLQAQHPGQAHLVVLPLPIFKDLLRLAKVVLHRQPRGAADRLALSVLQHVDHGVVVAAAIN